MSDSPDNTSLLTAISALQTQIASIQTNLGFLLEAIKELKAENCDKRNSIDTVATALRERVGKVEAEFNLVKWALGAITMTTIGIAATQINLFISKDNSTTHHQKMINGD